MGVRLLTSVLLASISGAAALAASVPAPHLPLVELSESVSAVLAGTILIVLGSAMRRGNAPAK